MNISAPGKELKWTGIVIYHIENGKIAYERGEEDRLGVLWQLGVVPKPA
jgi:predicted ester cyclase